MRRDLPTRGAYPRKILRRPCASWASWAVIWRSSSSGSGRQNSFEAILSYFLVCSLGPVLLVQCHVELQDVDPRLAQDAEIALCGVGCYQILHILNRRAAGLGHPRCLS